MNKMFPIEAGAQIRLADLQRALAPGTHLELTDQCAREIDRFRQYLESVIAQDDNPYYGINTGFGSMYRLRIPDDQIEALQINLIRSHAAGAGRPIPVDVARLVLLLKILTLSKGHSGVRRKLVDQLILYYNRGLVPVMYEFGSLGASGDLAPLAHLALTLIGQGAFYDGNGIADAAPILAQHKIDPIDLGAKEGLALINGTQYSLAYAVWSVLKAEKLMAIANLCAALSCDAFDCNISPFDQRIHAVRPFRGQQAVARSLRIWLEGSEIANEGDKELQDPYAFRCVPQVHGASLDTLYHAVSVVETEINAVTDNPLVFPDSGAILSGGNFHAQPLALIMDFLAIALAELANISERRTYQLLSGDRDLPTYLTRQAGVQSGLMILQYTAASIVSKNKQLCTPASVDSIVSSKGQEDHVSMSANAATKLYDVCNNCWSVLAIELMTAMQALEFRLPARTSPSLEEIRQAYRDCVPFIASDEVLHAHLVRTETFLLDLDLKTTDQS
ncbi:MAG: histidine ammonia-lyase [Saprospiraceae bacterium]|nr:histidine ammonia-lyase [Saprospiraceae bacterium]